MTKTPSLSVIREVMASAEFRDKPPVLVDVGASSSIHRDWAVLAPFSICIAFDPDERDFDSSQEVVSYRQCLKINAVVGAVDSDAETVYLTRSPYCSSTLRPLGERLAAYAEADLFEIVDTATVRAARLSSVLSGHDLEYVDWLKTDSQGLDLRVFRSLTPSQQARVIIAQLEPGIVDGYDGEDKLADVMKEFSNLRFWCAALESKGPVRGSAEMLRKYLGINQVRVLAASEKACAGWAEIEYINTFEAEALRTTRDLMLGWVVATLRGHHAFALELADIATRMYPRDHRFVKLLNVTLKGIQSRFRRGILRRGFAKVCRYITPSR